MVEEEFLGKLRKLVEEANGKNNTIEFGEYPVNPGHTL